MPAGVVTGSHSTTSPAGDRARPSPGEVIDGSVGNVMGQAEAALQPLPVDRRPAEDVVALGEQLLELLEGELLERRLAALGEQLGQPVVADDLVGFDVEYLRAAAGW